MNCEMVAVSRMMTNVFLTVELSLAKNVKRLTMSFPEWPIRN